MLRYVNTNVLTTEVECVLHVTLIDATDASIVVRQDDTPNAFIDTFGECVHLEQASQLTEKSVSVVESWVSSMLVNVPMSIRALRGNHGEWRLEG